MQEEGQSPVQPGCSGLSSPDEKVHSGHVNMNICQELKKCNLVHQYYLQYTKFTKPVLVLNEIRFDTFQIDLPCH